MTFVFDHLTAILVGATLVGALLLMQQRGQQAAIETTTRYRTETRTASFLATLARDTENARTPSQITTGLGEWAPNTYGDTPERAFGIHGTPERTEWMELVTLADPNAGGALIAVGYQSVETGDSVRVGATAFPLLRVDRYVYEPGAASWVQRGGSAASLTRFAVQARALDGTLVTNGQSASAAAVLSIDVASAHERLDRKASDQAALTQTNATQQSLSVRVVNATAAGPANVLAPPGAGPIPAFSGIAGAPPRAAPRGRQGRSEPRGRRTQDDG